MLGDQGKELDGQQLMLVNIDKDLGEQKVLIKNQGVILKSQGKISILHNQGVVLGDQGKELDGQQLMLVNIDKDLGEQKVLIKNQGVILKTYWTNVIF